MRTLEALAALVLACAVASGANISINGVNRAEFWAYFDSVWSTQTEDMLDLNIRYGNLRGEAGLFLYEPSKPWNDTRKPWRLFDYSIAYSPKQLEVLYGKFYQAFGKGLALRAYKDDDFRHYKSLHGLRGTAHLPLRTDVVLLAARMRDIFFQENTYKLMNVGDTADQVLGADLSSRPLSWKVSETGPAGFLAPLFPLLLRVGGGGRYVRINRAQDPTPKAFTELYGGDLTLSFGPVEMYGEMCQRLGTKAGIGGREKGFGFYTSATAAFPGFSVLGQYMDYDSIGFPPGVYHYNDPPTPIKSGVALDRGVNEQGFGAVVTATPWSPLYIEGDFGRLYRHDDTSAGVLEWETKARYSPTTALSLEAAFNHMLQKNVEAGTYERVVDRPAVHVNYLLGQHTFAFEGEVGLVDEQSTEGDSWNYIETALAVSYGYGDALLFTVGAQGVDEKLDKRYNGAVNRTLYYTLFGRRYALRNVVPAWPMFEAVWSITHRNMLRVRVGAERGGYTCSGGVCRFEAPFRGVKAQLISRF